VGHPAGARRPVDLAGQPISAAAGESSQAHLLLLRRADPNSHADSLKLRPHGRNGVLNFVEALKPTLREIIQADPTFPHGKHDRKSECEVVLESFIAHMLEQDPAGHTARWDIFDAFTTTPGGPGYYAVLWFVRRLVDYLNVNCTRPELPLTGYTKTDLWK
jgi:hypothetical protein